MKKFLLIYLLFLSCLQAFSQRNNNWYFGRRAALDFNAVPGQSVPVSIDNCAMISDEACATISDESGKLLFYTNGTTVYNKLHQVMQNGDNLDGNISATQVCIVPMPGNDSIYYIFTTGAIETSFTSGYKYSIVNMNLDNGNGAVVVKNSLLWPSCTERMTTARHANGIDIWLITNDNNSNIFRSWLISCNGLQPGPVSTVGIVMDQHGSTNGGLLKISPDGKYMCQSHFPYFDETLHLPNFVQLFDFNNSNGNITNPRSIGFPDAQFTHCEFSPNSQLLYMTRPYDKKIDQVDISLPNLPAILASRTTIVTQKAYFDIELAPDEKLYLAQPGQKLTVIEQPDTRGTGCNLQELAVDIYPGSVFLGLPTHINDVVSGNNPTNGFTYTILDSCSGKVQFNGITVLSGTINWDWDFGDGNISTQQNPVHTFTPAAGPYLVKLRISSSLNCGSILKSRMVQPQGIAVNNLDFSSLVKCDSGYVRFTNLSQSLIAAGTAFTWDFGDQTSSGSINPIHTYAAAGHYTVKLSNVTTTTCLIRTVVHEVDVHDFVIEAPPDQTIMPGQQVLLSAIGPPGNYSWTPSIWVADTSRKSTVAFPLNDIRYKVIATNSNGCTSSDSVLIHVVQYSDVFVPSAFTPNNDGRNDEMKPFFPGYVSMQRFSIYDRRGQEVFSSSERANGWDGKIKGVLQQTGVYVWLFIGKDSKGNYIERKGTCTLIR